MSRQASPPALLDVAVGGASEALTQARAIADTAGLIRELAHALKLRKFNHNELVRELALAYGHARDLAFALDLAVARHFADDAPPDLEPASSHARALTEVLHSARALDRVRVRALDPELARDPDQIRFTAKLDQLRYQARALDGYLQSIAIELQKPTTTAKTADVDASTERSSVAPVAQRLVTLTMVALPRMHRERYAEELRAELWDLAGAKATRSMQVLYAVQQLRRVWQLRNELRAPGRRRLDLLIRVVCWVLASDWRTWGVLIPLMVAALSNVIESQGWGSAFYTLPAVVGFYAGVEWLRRRWNVTVKRRRRSEE
ncbi:hypothetical protein ACFYOK_08430 [Microbispora bryophytorum]|uniref:hypothetical protein n=1 Tax=Microbispora bryophytorum TaxID=1460882 RepID=UPI0033EE5247